MATLTALKFPTPDGAKTMLETVRQLQKEHLIKIMDSAIVTWPQGKKKPQTKQLFNLGGVGALEGAFWGLLFGLIFFVPLFGAAIGAAVGGLAARFIDFGISHEFIQKVRDQVTEGTSALFLLTQGAVIDQVVNRMKGQPFELISTDLSADQEAMLREAFAADEVIWLE